MVDIVSSGHAAAEGAKHGEQLCVQRDNMVGSARVRVGELVHRRCDFENIVLPVFIHWKRHAVPAPKSFGPVDGVLVKLVAKVPLDQRAGIIWRHTVTELIPLLRRLAVVVRFAARLGAAEDVAHEPRVEVESKISQEGLI